MVFSNLNANMCKKKKSLQMSKYTTNFRHYKKCLAKISIVFFYISFVTHQRKILSDYKSVCAADVWYAEGLMSGQGLLLLLSALNQAWFRRFSRSSLIPALYWLPWRRGQLTTNSISTTTPWWRWRSSWSIARTSSRRDVTQCTSSCESEYLWRMWACL